MQDYRSPGYYPDPENPARERWWNGQGWSDSYRTDAANTALAEGQTMRAFPVSKPPSPGQEIKPNTSLRPRAETGVANQKPAGKGAKYAAVAFLISVIVGAIGVGVVLSSNLLPDASSPETGVSDLVSVFGVLVATGGFTAAIPATVFAYSAAPRGRR